MHINLEANNRNSIQSYDDQQIKVDSIIYRKSLILSTHEIISEWPMTSIHEVNQETLQPLLRYQPKIIIIGHKQGGKLPPKSIVLTLAKQNIGLETMSIGAACRTFNVLLNEQREVVLGLII